MGCIISDTPSAPLKVAVDNITENDVNLSWKAPREDGGARIKKYRVYKKDDKPGSDWVDAGIVDSYKTNAKVTGLSPDKNYLFAVLAENEAGPGEQSTTDKPVSPLKPISKFLTFSMLNLDISRHHFKLYYSLS